MRTHHHDETQVCRVGGRCRVGHRRLEHLSHLAHLMVAHAAPCRDVVAGSGIGCQHCDEGAGWGVSGGGGEMDHGQGAAQPSRVDLDLLHRSDAPRCARTAATAMGSSVMNRLISSSRVGPIAANGNVIRTFPWVSTPIAART